MSAMRARAGSAMSRPSRGVGIVLRMIAAAPLGLAVVVLLVLPGPRWSTALVIAVLTALGLAAGWIRWPRPELATGALLATVGGLAAHPVGPVGAVVVALCAGAFLLTAEAAEGMVWAAGTRREASVVAAGLELIHQLAARRRTAMIALVAVVAVGLGAVLPVVAAPVLVVIGAIGLGLMCWWAAAPRLPR